MKYELTVIHKKVQISNLLNSLLGRAWDGAVRTKNTTIALFGFKTSAAMSTLIEKLAGVSGHGFFFFKTALRACNNRFHQHCLHPQEIFSLKLTREIPIKRSAPAYIKSWLNQIYLPA